nr:glycosyltransferase family 4 protein [Fredinandcohnia onubensis]
MLEIVSFRPHVIANGTAFEAQAKIYKYLQRKYGWKFKIIQSEEDNFKDDELEVYSVSESSLRTFKGTNLLVQPRKFNNEIVSLAKGSDVILGCDPTIYSEGYLAYNLSKKIGAKLIYDASVTTFSTANGLKWKFKKGLVNKTINGADLIWITVPKVAERFANMRLENTSFLGKSVVLGHPVDINDKRPRNDNQINVLTVSRLVMEKGVHYIIKALSPLIKQNRNIQLNILGDGNAKSFLEKIIMEEGIKDNVKFIMPVHHNKIKEHYYNADILVTHPISNSHWEEFFGVVNLEGMSFGLPVVTTKSGGISYVLREKGIARLIPERDIVALTSEIENLIYDRNFRDKIGENGHRFVKENYSIEVIAEKYRGYIEALFK